MTGAYVIEVAEREPQPAAVLPRRVTFDRLADEIGSGIRRVESAVTAARVPVAGAPFVRYLALEPAVEIEIGLPLAGSHSVPTLRLGLLPGGAVATTWHEGPYSGLAGAYTALEEWIDAHGESAGAPWESYWTPLGAEHPRTQVVWPVKLP